VRPLACWVCGFESRRGHGCLSLVSVVYQAEVSVSDLSLVQRSSTECGVSDCDHKSSIIRILGHTGLLRHGKKKKKKKKRILVFT
jgi:hypothetical protein